jgi:GT2 family glycosyltransferase
MLPHFTNISRINHGNDLMINYVDIDVVIISNAKTPELIKITEDCIISLLESEYAIRFNVYIIESTDHEYFSLKPYFAKQVNDQQIHIYNCIHPKEQFGYNKFLNKGIELGSSEYVVLCNNDLIFHHNWASTIWNEMKRDESLMSASPFENRVHKNTWNLEPNTGLHYGYKSGKDITGWCIFTRRKLFDKIGKLDEEFIFWCADDDYGKTLEVNNIKHALVTNAFVDHIESRTLNTIDSNSYKKYTDEQYAVYNKKWNR